MKTRCLNSRLIAVAALILVVALALWQRRALISRRWKQRRPSSVFSPHLPPNWLTRSWCFELICPLRR